MLFHDDWTSNFLKTNGVRLHYVSAGQGPLLLLLHGFPEFWYSWRHQLSEFANDYRVVALDLRGYNLSEKPQDLSAYRISELVNDIAGAIAALGETRCCLAAHDWGGVIAWHFAYLYPHLLDRLIIMNCPHPAKFQDGMRLPQQWLKSSYMLFFQLPFAPEWLLQSLDYQLIASAFKALAVNQQAFSPQDLEAYKDAVGQRGALTAMLNYYRNLPSALSSTKSWDVLSVPTLMIWGENDPALGKELAEGTENYVSHLQLQYIANCGHWVQQEYPHQVNQFMRYFLQN
ncbi:alpha/beta hydrolase [Desertifilum sp. FACHB-1129]|uniref:Epoxide hydrolase n=1 Tax=Desertifilum tharense IPPAS B-1220 TaxID=1781255 RepID=A0A1E5QQ48_9CYAN|nr:MULTISPECIES: alpha/beta hydrolase [Desertifilum]MDA0209144.1 alpha/beta hydrolase [Cyanobacteria bacterium FC1]MBD2311798.1 alpha/beta hydrolase [Desertifilum sp. FACHB-1129]MBD2322942.1 alpha/beta hydrolase [Desertifilum sp. FACHB-866]MBD2333373.1 alpha/beta hydrolase [Desertifilum sp. FACHB-868]OEJ76786.1 epoxide hydrolase [Desertifilum tharense IPPAS B-1220]